MVAFLQGCQKASAGGRTALGDADVLLPHWLWASFSGPVKHLVVAHGIVAFSSKADTCFIHAKSLPHDPELFCITVTSPVSSQSNLLTNIAWGTQDTAEAPTARPARTRPHTHGWWQLFGQRPLSDASGPWEWHSVEQCMSRKYSILCLGY